MITVDRHNGNGNVQFASRLFPLRRANILCVGDLMLDHYIYGEVERTSPEALVPVLVAKHQETVIGGAGNVARNVASLGAHCTFVGVTGADRAGSTVAGLFAREADLIEA